MNPKIKQLWLAALRSGKYRQANGKLRNSSGAMCCIGVLGHIQGVPNQYLNERCGITLPHGKNAELRAKDRSTLARMNDVGIPFKKIADFIEKHY